MKLIDDELRPPKSLDITITMVADSLSSGNAIENRSEMLDILYHLQNFAIILHKYVKKEKNETEKPD